MAGKVIRKTVFETIISVNASQKGFVGFEGGGALCGMKVKFKESIRSESESVVFIARPRETFIFNLLLHK